MFFRENCVWQMILVLSFSRAPVPAAYNMFSQVNIFVYKNLPVSFLKLRITGQIVVCYSFSFVVIHTQKTVTIPMPSFRTSRHLQTKVHFRPAKPITSAKLLPYEIQEIVRFSTVFLRVLFYLKTNLLCKMHGPDFAFDSQGERTRIGTFKAVWKAWGKTRTGLEAGHF